MSERRRIRLAVIPTQDEEEVTVPKTNKPNKKLRVKVTVAESKRRQDTSSPRKNATKTPVKSNPLFEKGKRIIARSIDATGMVSHFQESRDQQVQDGREELMQDRIRATLLEQTDRVQRHLGAKVVPNGIDSLENTSSYGSESTLSQSLSADSESSSESSVSFASSATAGSNSVEVDGTASYDTYGSSSIVADASYGTEESSSTMRSDASSTVRSETSSTTTGHAGIDTIWGAFQTLQSMLGGSTTSSGTEELKKKKKTRERSTGQMEMLLEVNSSDSWIESIHTNSDESFDAALNKELDYHCNKSVDPSWVTIHDRVRDTIRDNKERKSSAELSDSEFLRAIRQALDSNTTAATGKISSTAGLSDTEFLQVLRQSMNGQTTNVVRQSSHVLKMHPTRPVMETIPEEEYDMANDDRFSFDQNTPVKDAELSNANFMKALRQHGAEANAAMVETELSNSNCKNALWQQKEDSPEAMKAPPVALSGDLTNEEFLVAMRESLQAEEDTPETMKAPPVALSDDLTNEEFLVAMRESLQAEGGNFVDGPEPVSELSNDAFMTALRHHGVEDRDDVVEPELSNADFLEAMRQTSLEDDDSIGETDPSQATTKSQLLDALRQMNGVSHDGTMFGTHSNLETIDEADSVVSSSTHSTPSPSPGTSLAIEENNIIDEILNEKGRVDNCDSTIESEGVVEIESAGFQSKEVHAARDSVTKLKDIADSPPGLQLVSSDASDTRFDLPSANERKEEGWTEFQSTFTTDDEPMTSILATAANEEDTNFFSEAKETDTNFLSAMDDDPQMWQETQIGSYDSLDEFFNHACNDMDVNHQPSVACLEIARNDSPRQMLNDSSDIAIQPNEIVDTALRNDSPSDICNNGDHTIVNGNDESKNAHLLHVTAPEITKSNEPKKSKKNERTNALKNLIDRFEVGNTGPTCQRWMAGRSSKSKNGATTSQYRPDESRKKSLLPMSEEVGSRATLIPESAIAVQEECIPSLQEIGKGEGQLESLLPLAGQLEIEEVICCPPTAAVDEHNPAMIAVEEVIPERQTPEACEQEAPFSDKVSDITEKTSEEKLVSLVSFEKKHVSVISEGTVIESLGATKDDVTNGQETEPLVASVEEKLSVEEVVSVPVGSLDDVSAPVGALDAAIVNVDDDVFEHLVPSRRADDQEKLHVDDTGPKDDSSTALEDDVAKEPKPKTKVPQKNTEVVSDATETSLDQEKNDSSKRMKASSLHQAQKADSSTEKTETANDRKARNDLIRAVFQDPTLSSEEKKTLIRALVEGASLDEPSSPRPALALSRNGIGIEDDVEAVEDNAVPKNLEMVSLDKPTATSPSIDTIVSPNDIVMEENLESMVNVEAPKEEVVKATAPATSRDVNAQDIDTVAKRNDQISEKKKDRDWINKEIGRKLLDGWAVLEASCPDCMIPLMTDYSQAKEATCVCCGLADSIVKEDGSKINTLAPPAPPPPMAKTRKGRKCKKKSKSLVKTQILTTVDESRDDPSVTTASE